MPALRTAFLPLAALAALWLAAPARAFFLSPGPPSLYSTDYYGDTAHTNAPVFNLGTFAQTDYGYNHAKVSLTSPDYLSATHFDAISAYSDTFTVGAAPSGGGMPILTPTSVQFVIGLDGLTSSTLTGSSAGDVLPYAELDFESRNPGNGVSAASAAGPDASIHSTLPLYGSVYGSNDDWNRITTGGAATTQTFTTQSYSLVNGQDSIAVNLLADIDFPDVVFGGIIPLSGTVTSDFSHTGTLAGLLVYDQYGHLMAPGSYTVADASGATYPFPPAAAAVPESPGGALLALGLAVLALPVFWKRRRRGLLPVSAAALIFVAALGLAPPASAQIDDLTFFQAAGLSPYGPGATPTFNQIKVGGYLSGGTTSYTTALSNTTTSSLMDSVTQAASTTVGKNHASVSITLVPGTNSVIPLTGAATSIYSDAFLVSSHAANVTPTSLQYQFTLTGSVTTTGDIGPGPYYPSVGSAAFGVAAFGATPDGLHAASSMAPSSVTSGTFGGGGYQWYGITSGSTFITPSYSISSASSLAYISSILEVSAAAYSSVNGGTLSANFGDTAALTGLVVYDQNGRVIPGADLTITSVAGGVYPFTAAPAVPEPASLALLALGLPALAGAALRRPRAA